uniref:Uncharacterized protein n=1 Tax=Anguilla anguilla TaxID=7936 RepID=A0A0E9XAM3_ANGAN
MSLPKMIRASDYVQILQISLTLCLSQICIKWHPGAKRRLNVLKSAEEQTSFSIII